MLIEIFLFQNREIYQIITEVCMAVWQGIQTSANVVPSPFKLGTYARDLNLKQSFLL